MINELPFQKFIKDNVQDKEFNMGYVFKLPKGESITYAHFEKAMHRLIKNQPFLNLSYSDKDELIHLPFGETFELHYHDFREEKRSYKEMIDEFISKQSKVIHHSNKMIFSAGFCECEEFNLIYFVTDHLYTDGFSIFLFVLHIENELFNNLSLDLKEKFNKLQDFISHSGDRDRESYKYWDVESQFSPCPISNTKKSEGSIIHKMSIEETKRLTSILRKKRANFDEIFWASFTSAYKETFGISPNSITVHSDLRSALSAKEYFLLIGPLAYAWHLIFGDVKDTIEDNYRYIQQHTQEVKETKIDYSIAVGKSNMSSFSSPILYSNMGNIDKMKIFTKHIQYLDWYDIYYHGDTFDENLTRYSEIHIRPFIEDRVQNTWITYNSNRYNATQINSLIDKIINNIFKLLDN